MRVSQLKGQRVVDPTTARIIRKVDILIDASAGCIEAINVTDSHGATQQRIAAPGIAGIGRHAAMLAPSYHTEPAIAPSRRRIDVSSLMGLDVFDEERERA